MGDMQTQTVKTTIEIEANLFYLAKMKALQENMSLKEVFNFSLAKSLNADKQKTVNLFSKIQEIVEESSVKENELQKSGKDLRKQLVKKYYQKK
jgi:hypothetical protein